MLDISKVISISNFANKYYSVYDHNTVYVHNNYVFESDRIIDLKSL